MDATRTNAFTNRGRYASVTYSITFFKKKYIAYLYFLINFKFTNAKLCAKRTNHLNKLLKTLARKPRIDLGIRYR